MPIKNFVTGEIPFLKSYTPFVIPEEVSPVYTVEDMVSYDLQVPVAPVPISYEIGSRTSFITEINVKNITSNVDLLVTIEYDNTVFVVNNADFGVESSMGNRSSTSVTLPPNSISKFGIEINKNTLNSTLTNGSGIEKYIKMKVTNISTNDMTYVPKMANALASRFLPETITIE
jgi:hypothetical protein